MFQQHQGESLSEAWTRFKDLLQKVPHHGIDRWLQIQNFYNHVSFHLKYEIDHSASGKLRDKNADKSWEIIENVTLYDHEGKNDSKEFVKPVKAISIPQTTEKTPDRRLLELKDQINFLLRGLRPTPRPSSKHTPQAYAEAIYSNPRPQNQNEPPKQNPFTFHEHTGPNPQPRVLGTIFKAQVRDYMAADTKRMERAPKKVLIREDVKSPVTKNVNSISLARGEEEGNDNDDMAADNDINRTNTEITVKEAEKETEAENGTKNKPIKRAEREENAKASSSQPIGYYLKHRITEKLIEGLVDNHRFNDSLSGIRVGKVKGKTYNLLPRGPVYEAILRKKITRKEDIGGNFEIPCNIGGLKCMNALVDQGSDVNVMPLSTYMKLTDERPTKTDIRLSLASYSYIYPLGIAKDVLVDVVGYVYPVDFFDKGTVTLRSGKSKISFHRIPETLCKVKKGIKNDVEPIAPTMTVNRLVLEWEERIRLHQEKEMKFDQWRSKNFNNKHPALIKVEGEMNEGEVT
ncbi:MAK10-like protein [Tanacetum coccineum]